MIFQWIKDYINDIRDSWVMVRYKRSRNDSLVIEHSQRSQDIRMQQRQEMWIAQSQFHQDAYRAANQYNIQAGGHGGNGYVAYSGGYGGSSSSEGEWSNGDTGLKIIKRVDAGGKSIGLCKRFEDLFYVMTKNIDESSYHTFIYLDKDGMDKHGFDVEIIGVDLI